MLQQVWVHECGKNIVCVDSYDDGVLKGCFYNPYQEVEHFASLSQFLIKMEQMLDERNVPQAYTSPRKFSVLLQPENRIPPTPTYKGAKATFELKVLFRQHTSWQGVLLWRERNAEHSFRSVLELVHLIDSALRSIEGSGVA